MVAAVRIHTEIHPRRVIFGIHHNTMAVVAVDNHFFPDTVWEVVDHHLLDNNPNVTMMLQRKVADIDDTPNPVTVPHNAVVVVVEFAIWRQQLLEMIPIRWNQNSYYPQCWEDDDEDKDDKVVLVVPTTRSFPNREEDTGDDAVGKDTQCSLSEVDKRMVVDTIEAVLHILRRGCAVVVVDTDSTSAQWV